MEQTPKRVTVPLLLIILMLLGFNPLAGDNTPGIKFIERLDFVNKSDAPISPWDLSVTDDELYLIPDFRAGGIKIYQTSGKNLELIDTIGRKGYGRDELVNPAFCFYNKAENKFVVMDFGVRKIFFYDRMGRIDFKRVKEVRCWGGLTDIQLKDNRLFISGVPADSDKKNYNFYYIELLDNQTIPLLPAYVKYGIESSREFEMRYVEKYIPSIGIYGYFDVYNEFAYYVWEGNLNVIKINFESGDIDRNSFLEQGGTNSRYVKPYASMELVVNYERGNREGERMAKAKMSFVTGVFTTSKYVLVIYEGPMPVNQDKASKAWLRFYTLDGGFVEEKPIPRQPGFGSKVWLDKDKEVLYTLSTNTIKEGEEVYYILKYKISQ